MLSGNAVDVLYECNRTACTREHKISCKHSISIVLGSMLLRLWRAMLDNTHTTYNTNEIRERYNNIHRTRLETVTIELVDSPIDWLKHSLFLYMFAVMTFGLYVT